MSIESIATALHHSKAKGTAKLVLLGIANHDGDGGAFPAMATLARYAGVDIRNARAAVRKLEELGEIRTFGNGGELPDRPRNYQPNRYEFLVMCPPHCDRTKNHRDSRKPLFNDQDRADAGIRSIEYRADEFDTSDRMEASDKPSFNHINQFKKETQVNSTPTIHEYDDVTGWCLKCIHPAHRLDLVS